MAYSQKTWIQLLGSPDGAKLDGRYFVRLVGARDYVVLWAFDNDVHAAAAFEAWLGEWRQYQARGASCQAK